MNTKSKRGRPKGPERVVFKRRVSPEKVPLLEGVLLGKAGSGVEDCVRRGDGVWVPVAEAVPPPAVPEREQILALLEDVDKITKDRDYWKGRFEKAVNATEHQMAVYWKHECEKARKRAAELENLSQ